VRDSKLEAKARRLLAQVDRTSSSGVSGGAAGVGSGNHTRWLAHVLDHLESGATSMFEVTRGGTGHVTGQVLRDWYADPAIVDRQHLRPHGFTA
jgi:hypothetical protein